MHRTFRGSQLAPVLAPMSGKILPAHERWWAKPDWHHGSQSEWTVM